MKAPPHICRKTILIVCALFVLVCAVMVFKMLMIIFVGISGFPSGPCLLRNDYKWFVCALFVLVLSFKNIICAVCFFKDKNSYFLRMI